MMRQCDWDSTDNSLAVAVDCLAATSLFLSLVADEGAEGKTLAKASTAELGKISAAILKMVRISARDGLLWTAVFSFQTTMATVVSEQSPTLGHILLSQNAIVDICHALAFYSSLSLPESSMGITKFRLCIVCCFQDLVGATQKPMDLPGFNRLSIPGSLPRS
jgi:hypothetical protein